jgi:peptidoglycan/LPS O-acetylase OafA/YrhL
MKSPHSPALDGLRWFSFLAVFLFHSNESAFRFGRYGVQLFFVLSGFLIGNILLSLREEAQIPLIRRLKTFYIRRSLRIFPLYYFVLLMIALLGGLHLMNGHLPVLPYHALYLTNFYLALTGAKIDAQTHLWSLCVEEHFYLLAPLALLVVSYRRLAITCACLFLLVAVARTCNFLFWGNPRFAYLSPIQFDVLTAGIVAAVLVRGHDFLGLNERRLKIVGCWCGVASLVVLVWAYFPSSAESFVESVIFPPMLGAAISALLLTLWHGGLPITRRFLSWAPFVYLGQISYGLYVYHYFLMFVFTGYSTGLQRAARLVPWLLATIVIASLSWRLLEKPLLSLKRRYDYPSGTAPELSTPKLGGAGALGTSP